MYNFLLGVQYFNILGTLFLCTYIFKHWKTRLHGYLFLSCAATLVNNAGYLIVMLSDTPDISFAGVQMSYLGRVWIPFAMFLFVITLCHVHIPRQVLAVLGIFHAATYGLVLTTRWHSLYYRDLSFEKSGLFPHLGYSYGIGHHIFTGVIILYIVTGLFFLIRTAYREKNKVAKRRLYFVIATVISESGCYILQFQKLIEGYDTTVIGYTIGMVFMSIAILRYDLLDTREIAQEYVIDELTEAVVVVDANGKVEYFNARAKALLPMLASDADNVADAIRAAAERGEPLRLGERIYTPEANVLRHGGLTCGAVYVLTDDTEHYRYLEELKEQKRIADEANRAKSAFLANMSHEIRTPINAILGMDEMILRESSERRITGYAEDIQNAGKTLLSLINDILDFSKVEEGKMEILPAQYDLSSLINDLTNMILGRAESKGLRFEVKADETTPHLLYGDEIRIRQCALNILTNAVKYTEKGSVTLTIGYEKRSEDKILLKFRVSDTGIGMKQEDMDKLFSPFSRIEEFRNRSIEGTGLGMSITRQLLDLMGSELKVESVYGEGSTFSFAIEQTVIKWEGVGFITCRIDQSSGKRKTYRELFRAPDAHILVVDDTPVNLTVIRGLLKRTKLQVDTAESGAEALKKAAERQYDAIFIDHMMPEMDGIETLKRLRKLPGAERTPCIALTANAISGAREAYLAAGFSDYLSKPVDGRRLEKMLKAYLPPEKVHEPPEPAAEAEPHAFADKPLVLVVDDDEVICKLAGDILDKTFRVEACQRGTDAPTRAATLRPDLILLDINLGGLSGFDVLKTLREQPETDQIPVVFLTGESDGSAEIEGFRSGASDFVRKPFIPEVLLQRTKRIIALDRLQRDLQSEVRRQTLRAERLTKEMMLALSQTVDAKDHYTNGHSERVAAYSAEIARRMGKDAREQEHIYEMGLMHDIGKIGVAEEIINKTSRLSDEEFEKIKRHTVIGSEILRLITEMPELAYGARSHHERFDGTGYPDGLKGEDIPEAARIICLADCYDAMTSTRTYSTPREQAAVRAEIERCSGTQFDPEIAKVMLQMIDEDTGYIMNEKGADIRVWKGSGKLWSLEEPAPAAPAAAEAPEEEEEPPAELPEWLSGIGELNVENGLMHCGTEETYLDTLTIYGKNAAANADEIEALWKAGDAANVTVKVHALKSTSRAIGAEELGALAEKLEMAGKAGDTQTLQAELGGLLERFRALGERLSPLFAQEQAADDLPPIEEDKLREAYETIREFAASLDSDGAAYVLNYLDGFRIPDGERERCERIRRAVANFDWDQIDEILN